MTEIEKLALAIKQYEGYFPFSRSWRNKNPGNLRWSPFQAGQRGGYAYFRTYEEGWKALIWDLRRKILGKSRTKLGPHSTLKELFEVYAPSADRNKPLAYAEFVAKKLEIDIDTPLSYFLENDYYNREKSKEAPDQVLHVVKKWETMWGIAKEYGVNSNDLIKVNPHIKNPSLILPGQILRIPVKDFTDEAYYRVKEGDTLIKIANKHNTDWRTIYNLNRDKIKDPNRIYPGQLLRIF